MKWNPAQPILEWQKGTSCIKAPLPSFPRSQQCSYGTLEGKVFFGIVSNAWGGGLCLLAHSIWIWQDTVFFSLWFFGIPEPSWLRCGCLDVHSSGKSLSFQLSPECQFTVSGCFSFLPLLHLTFNKGWKSDSWGMGLWRIKFVLFCVILGNKGTEANREKSVVPNPLCVYVGVFFLDTISGI